MEIRQILYSLARKWWLIVLLAGIGGGSAFLIVYYATPMYQADTKLFILNRDRMLTADISSRFQDLEVTQQLVRQSTEIISSRLITSAVFRDINNFSITEKELLAMITIKSKIDSNIVTISVRWSDPTIAAAVANAIGSEFRIQIRQLTNSDILSVVDQALVPHNPVPNNRTLKILLGILVGVMFSFGIIYIIEYFDTTVRSAEDIEKGLKVRVIGIIPEHDIP